MEQLEKILGQTTFATLPNVIFNETLKLEIDVYDTLLPLLFNAFVPEISNTLITMKALIYLVVKYFMDDEKAIYKAILNFLGVYSGDELTPFLNFDKYKK
jgi:hypothetical protein